MVWMPDYPMSPYALNGEHSGMTGEASSRRDEFLLKNPRLESRGYREVIFK